MEKYPDKSKRLSPEDYQKRTGCTWEEALEACDNEPDVEMDDTASVDSAVESPDTSAVLVDDKPIVDPRESFFLNPNLVAYRKNNPTNSRFTWQPKGTASQVPISDKPPIDEVINKLSEMAKANAEAKALGDTESSDN